MPGAQTTCEAIPTQLLVYVASDKAVGTGESQSGPKMLLLPIGCEILNKILDGHRSRLPRVTSPKTGICICADALSIMKDIPTTWHLFSLHFPYDSINQGSIAASRCACCCKSRIRATIRMAGPKAVAPALTGTPHHRQPIMEGYTRRSEGRLPIKLGWFTCRSWSLCHERRN